jgi:hypothetical protein
MESIVKVTVWVPDQHALTEVLAAAAVSLECGAPRRDADGTFAVTLYASPAEAAKVAALPYRSELDDTYGSVLAERQREVSKRDRFKGGTVRFQGLGEKR